MSLSSSQGIIIHCGPPKTGSSRLQNWLSAHTEELLQQGIFYPGHKVDSSGISSGNPSEIIETVNKDELQIGANLVAAVLKKYKKSKANYLLLSSEFFVKDIQQIAHHIPAAIPIYYLRTPIATINSKYNQSLKRLGNSAVLNADDFTMFTMIEDFISHRSTIFRQYYDDDTWDIVDDFKDLFAIDTIPTGSNNRVNTSCSFEALELKRYLNCIIDDLDRNRALVSILQKNSVGVFKYSCIPQEQQSAIIETAVDTLSRLNRKERIASIDSFAQRIKSEPILPYKKQGMAFDGLEEICRFIESSDPSLYSYLQERIRNTPEVAKHIPEFVISRFSV